MKPGDQILAIDRYLFTNDLSHEDAINILQSAKGIIRLIVARPITSADAKTSTFINLNSATNKETKNADQIRLITSSSVEHQLASSKPFYGAAATTVTTTNDSQLPQKQPISIINSTTNANFFDVKRSPSDASDSSKDSLDMVLSTEWAQLECINLETDGNGLGFGIFGGRSSGVIVKTVVPGGAAAKVCSFIFIQFSKIILKILGQSPSSW